MSTHYIFSYNAPQHTKKFTGPVENGNPENGNTREWKYQRMEIPENGNPKGIGNFKTLKLVL